MGLGIVQIVIGLILGNALEWGIHKGLLHGLGKRKASWWSFHWRDHHRLVRQHAHIDEDYLKSPFAPDARGQMNGQGKELLGLVGGGLLLAPIAWFAPWTYGALLAHGVAYYGLHRRSHLDTAWAKRWLPWHYDHHMAPNQEANWCVTWPLFDWIMGTREPYLGTERERRQQARKLAREQGASVQN